MLDWNDYPNFSEHEFACRCGCARADMDPAYMAKLQAYRDRVGPLKVNSGLRCENHPIEAKKTRPGAHSTGMAADLKPLGVGLYEALRVAFEMGFQGIGIENGFLHLDEGHPDKPRPTAWTY